MPYLLSGNAVAIEVLPDASSVKRCPECSMPLDRWSEDIDTRKSMKADFGKSYEGVWLASRRFHAVCIEGNVSGVTWAPLSSGQFAILPDRAVRTDHDFDKIQWLGETCGTCGEPDEIISKCIYPMLALGEHIAPNEMVRSEQLYLTRRARRYQLFIGDSLAERLRKARLKGTIAIVPLTPRP